MRFDDFWVSKITYFSGLVAIQITRRFVAKPQAAGERRGRISSNKTDKINALMNWNA
jgi:hypothetical protein